MNVLRVCARQGCVGSLDGRRASTVYCTDRCRVAACRERKAREAQNKLTKGDCQGEGRVTLTEPLETLVDLLGGPCPDPTHCSYRLRHASGPWTCEYNHPRDERQDRAA